MSLWPSVLAGRADDSYLTVSISGANDLSLTVDQAVAREIVFSGALTGSVNAIFPVTSTDAGALWMIHNATSGAYTLTVKAATGGTVAVTQGKRCLVLWTGVDFVPWVNDVKAMGAAASGSNGDITALTSITGGVTATGAINTDKVQGANVALAFGYLTKTITDANYTLTSAEMANSILDIAGTLTAGRNIILPLTAGAFYLVRNNGTGQTLTLAGATGTGAAVANNKWCLIACNGTNWYAVSAPN